MVNSFLHSVHTWLLSVWRGNHPNTLFAWAYGIHSLALITGVVLAIFGRKIRDWLLVVLGVTDLVVACWYAYMGSQFFFWVWAALAVFWLIRPVYHFRNWLARRRAAQAAKIVPPRSAS